MLSPDYRLLPESSGHEILEDVRDFWTWVHECLPAELEKLGLGVKVDPSKIAAGGESAGMIFYFTSLWLIACLRLWSILVCDLLAITGVCRINESIMKKRTYIITLPNRRLLSSRVSLAFPGCRYKSCYLSIRRHGS